MIEKSNKGESRILEMDTTKRVKMVACMEYILRHLNDESLFDMWLMLGVADGDIPFGELDPNVEDLEDYIEDENFAELMDLFIRCISKAKDSGGLYCDKVVSHCSDD